MASWVTTPVAPAAPPGFPEVGPPPATEIVPAVIVNAEMCTRPPAPLPPPPQQPPGPPEPPLALTAPPFVTCWAMNVMPPPLPPPLPPVSLNAPLPPLAWTAPPALIVIVVELESSSPPPPPPPEAAAQPEFRVPPPPPLPPCRLVDRSPYAPPPPAPTPPAGAGLRFSAQPQNQSSNIFNNNDFIGNLPGAINTDTDPIDGTNNYWGAADGPSGVGPGSGDIVSGPPTPGTGVITFAPFSTIPQSFAGSLCNPFTPTPTATATPTATPTNTPTNPPATQRPTPTQVLVGGVTVGTFAPAVVAAVTSGASGSLAPTVLGGLGLLVAAAFVVGVRRRRDR